MPTTQEQQLVLKPGIFVLGDAAGPIPGVGVITSYEREAGKVRLRWKVPGGLMLGICLRVGDALTLLTMAEEEMVCACCLTKSDSYLEPCFICNRSTCSECCRRSL